MKPKVTAIIPCKNEQKNIRQCIESLDAVVDEILVADSGSTDRTMQIAAEHPKVRVIEREYRTSGDFKNWAIPQANHEWILLLDADERLTEPLRREIEEVLSRGASQDGYWIYRMNHFMGHRVPYGDSATDKVIRLFRRDVCWYEGPSDHGEVHVSTGRVGYLREKMLHYTCWDYDQVFVKFHRYTGLQAQQWHEAGLDTSYFKLLIRPAFRFFREYVLQFGFLNGKAGVQLAMLAAFYSFTKQARLWELNHRLPQPVPAQDRDEQDDLGAQVLPLHPSLGSQDVPVVEQGSGSQSGSAAQRRAA
jgi:glycosyltransferase involved in cell wall biosynthesis